MSSAAIVAGQTQVDVPGGDQAMAGMGVLSAIFGVLLVAAVGLIIYSAVRRARAARAAGLDPFAGDIQLMGAAKESRLLAPERSMEERLAEVDALLAAGAISQDEHDAARARIISSL